MDRSELVNQSIDYIMQHLDEDLSLDTVAAHFFISKYHFSRIFREETGESLYSFIKRCKIDQSAIDMKLNPEKAITDIGLDYGYSASNYSSVFRKHHDTSPAGFRHSIPVHSMAVPFAPERVVHFKTAEEYAAQIKVQKLDDLFVLYERFIGSYIELEKNWYRFLDKYRDVYKRQVSGKTGALLYHQSFHWYPGTDDSHRLYHRSIFQCEGKKNEAGDPEYIEECGLSIEMDGQHS